MDTSNGGQSLSDKQRQTAAEIARRKVLEAYGADGRNYARPEDKSQPKIDEREWKQYHSAWQDYYQKYYGEYYQKAAKDYVEQSKLKTERTQSEKGAGERVKPTREEAEGIVGRVERKYIRGKIREKASDHARKVRRSKHFVPIVVGALVVVLGVLFQYNQVIIANAVAYISPGGGTVNNITAIDPSVTSAVGPDSVLIIPKLNVEVPVVFGSANDTASMNNAMSNGVAHFAIPGASAVPGEVGNFVISGHSAGNVYRASDYKFIFSGLDRLVAGDLIYMNYNSVRYTYSVTDKQTVEPTDVAALTYQTDKPVMTLITCTPLGTSRYRLLVSAEQISPDATGAASAEPGMVDESDEIEMPANDPAPLQGFWGWLTGQG